MDAKLRLGVLGLNVALLTLVTACGSPSSARLGSAADAPQADVAAEAGAPPLDPLRVAKGEQLFGTYCQACHGVEGVGESPEDPQAVDENGFPLAPALDDSMHAWHHSDEGLVQTILQGSARNPRMTAWSKAGLSESDASDIVVYMKSFWGEMPRRCQGALHMDRNCVLGDGS